MFKFLPLFILLFPFTFPTTVHASGSCDATVAQSSVQTSTDTNFSFTISNSGSNTISAIKITRPSANFTLENYGVSGWSVNANNEFVELTGGAITAGGSTSISYHGVSGSSEAGSANWTVETSDGSGYVSCTGSLGTSISGVRDVASPIMSEVTVTGIYATQANITWTTNETSTSKVDYSTTSGDYTLLKEGSSATSHNLALSGLTANTTYYLVAYSTDLSGNSTSTDEFSFTTAAADAGVATTVTVNTTTTTSTVNTVVKIQKDETPPTVRFKTIFQKIYEESPLVETIADDGTGISRIEYSIDNGKNWMNIDITDSLGDKQINSIFTPNAIEDGDYTLVVKVTDTTGNKVLSKEAKFTIDRLPPRVGPLTVMAGPIIINIGNSGNMELLAGIEYKFILSSAGGPNKISLKCNEDNYDFIKNNDIGVWTAKIKFNESGSCIPEITAVDGAGNEQQVKSAQLIVNSLGQIKNSTVTVYWYDDFEKKFVKWDGEPYGQSNPINTNDLGGYSFLLPSGKYYLEAKSVGKRTSVSNIIEIHETVYINDDWELSPAWKFWQISEEKKINAKILGSTSFKDVSFALPKVNLNNLSTLDIRGKTTVVVLLSSWHPITNDYLKVMDELTKNKYSIFPVLIQEKETSATALERRGGYGLNIYADGDGEILVDTTVSGLPTTWIVNRFGQVIKTKVGEVSFQEILDMLSNID